MSTNNPVGLTVLIGIGFTFIIIATMIILVVRKMFLNKRVKAHFITQSGQRSVIFLKKASTLRKVKYNKGTYLYDPKCAIVNFRGQKEIYYMEGNPTPLHFGKKGLLNSSISSENLKNVIETELIDKLFKQSKIEVDNVLTIICLVALGVVLVMLWGIKDNGVTIANNPENIETLRIVIKQALATGV